MAAALLPAVFLMWYIRKQDRVEREPTKFLFSIVGLGAASTISAIFLEKWGGSFLSMFLQKTSILYIALYYFLVVAGAEELGKFVVLRLRTWNAREFNYTYDAVVFSVAASLGFAALENVLYVFIGGLTTAVARAVTAVPGHAMFGVFMGCHYGLAKRAAARGFQGEYRLEMLKAFLIPVVLHGFYDFCLSAPEWYWSGVFFIFYLAAIAVAFVTIRKLAAEDSPVDLDSWYDTHQ
jgi:RsiW-degrading membrane proteinase PrsW (M82 family)